MHPLSNIKVGIVCPMANEGKGSTAFVRAVLEKCEGFREVLFFAVLDEITTDNSLLLLREMERVDPRLKVVWAPENRCVVDAYVRGYREALIAGADWILEIDAGFSHQPQDIPQFFEAMPPQGYDCVFGSRFMKGGRVPWRIPETLSDQPRRQSSVESGARYQRDGYDKRL
jgi:dolichol-phosphate mannosyltransferase